MKNKLWVGALGIVLLVAGLGIYWRYREVNRAPQQLGVTREVFFKAGDWVQAKNVKFKVEQANLRTDQDKVRVTIRLSLHQNDQTAYGQIRGHRNFLENMWCVFPYRFSTATEHVFDKNKQRIHGLENLLHSPQPYTLKFVGSQDDFAGRDRQARFSFLVPEKHSYTKYSLLLE
ncbi:hypothetical protein HU830_06295 [Lactobacillus sp. DCY120]|uniref:DUF4352 domain-containing protein n=1 Tax=Bombilactobacillus apium TaxID=2675299 RepID=A0A850QY58_9LACO|nr:hypothetical protein [Bombilactobacillus apium]NVY96764.1 hypothetical protein [Bombilactobacillus apium]